MKLLVELASIFLLCCQPVVGQPGSVVWSVNAGGPEHWDYAGIYYQEDMSKDGIESNFGQQRFLGIGRVEQNDAILYQTERYSLSTFGYDIPLKDDGQYVLVLKFCEVYFTRPKRKVFDVTLNYKHTIVNQLDIYAKVGHGNAHDEIIPFLVSGGGKLLLVNGETSAISRNTIRVEFIKGPLDNPKINAIYVWKGSLEEIQQLRPLSEDDTINDYDTHNVGQDELDMEDAFPEESSESFGIDEYIDEDIPVRTANRRKSTQRPYYKDPYEDEDIAKYFGPVLLAAGVCIVGCIAFMGLTKRKS